MSVHYSIKRPTNGRRTFAITRVETVAGKVRNTTVTHPSLVAANAAYTAGHQDQEKTFLQIKDLVRVLKQAEGLIEQKAVFSSENLAIVAKYWEHRYSEKVKMGLLEDPETMRGDLNRAAKACGIVSIASGPREDLQKAVNRLILEDGDKDKMDASFRRQRRAVQRVNEMLRWLNRGFRLEKAKNPKPTVKYLTLDDVKKVCEHLSDKQRMLVWVLFGTGCRLGEAFTIDDYRSDEGFVHIRTQRRTDWVEKETKTRAEPFAAVVREADDWVQRWASLPEEEKKLSRNWKAREHITRACRKAFPDDRSKHCHWHHLRHSYAKHMLFLGAQIDDVAAWLGDNIQTAHKVYGQKTMTRERVRATVARLRRG